MQANGQPIFHCSQCGLTNPVGPRCSRRTSWSNGDVAGHAPGSSQLRVRHASAPLPVFFQFCLHHPRYQPHDDPWGVTLGKMSLGQTSQTWRQNSLFSQSGAEINAHSECSEDFVSRGKQSTSMIRMIDAATVTPPVSI